jgi:SAM-dependent methyltransferase
LLLWDYSHWTNQRPARYHSGMNSYELIAPYYDLEHGGYQDDIDLYCNYADSTGSPVLELGCGTGRLLVPLARRGIELTGVDSSPAMLARARQHLEAAMLLNQVELIEGDGRTLRLRQRFRLAFVALNTFAHFITRDDQRAVLAKLRQHLLPEGTLILDLPHADLRHYQETEGHLFHQGTWIDQSRNEIVSHLVAAATDPVARCLQLTHFYDAHSQGETIRRIVVQTSLAMLSPGEAELLVESCGFQLNHLYGDYELNPCEENSPRLILVATRVS